METVKFPNSQTPVKAVVELLENVLKRAKDGQVRTVFFVGLCSDGGVISAWEDGKSTRVFMVIGAVNNALFEYQSKMVKHP